MIGSGGSSSEPVEKAAPAAFSFFAANASFLLRLFVVLAITAAAYYPGLDGPFLFDDYANLPEIGATGPVDNAATFARYITSGTADPTGRPVAMLTFLIDARDWPANPRPFKRTNLIVHLINGLLLATFLRRLGYRAFPRATSIEIQSAAVLSAGWWLLHPLFVSTTLYVVQREAMLPATTILIGLHCWVSLRATSGHRSSLKQWGWAGGVLAMTVIGAFAKANGLLLPLLIGAVELCLSGLLGADRRNAEPKMLIGLVVIAPSALLLVYLISQGIIHNAQGLPRRDWTEVQRLITEPRVIWTYLRMLWIPAPYTAGVFNDQFLASDSLLHPWTTLPSLAGIVGIVSGAFVLRSRHPAFSLGLLFFIAGHSLESTTVPLELYFEHRNYVPAMMLFWAPSLWISHKIQHAKNTLDRVTLQVLSIVLLSTLAVMTFANARVWGDDRNQALRWASVNPRSLRAQVMASQAEVALGYPSAARDRLMAALSTAPDEVQVTLNLISAECSMGSVSPMTLAAAEKSLSTARDPGSLITSWFGRAIGVAGRQECSGLDTAALDRLAEHALSNPRWEYGRRQDVLHVRGQIALSNGDVTRAQGFFQEALSVDPTPGLALNEAAALGAAGAPAEGIEHLSYFRMLDAKPRSTLQGMPRLHEWVLRRQQYWKNETTRLEAQLRSDMMSSGTVTHDK